jgi:mono/diheme cytochrome c family protein
VVVTATGKNDMRALTSVFVGAVLLAMALPAAAQDSAAGQKVFTDSKCSMCHSVAGVGNKKFPLDGVGKKGAEHIKMWLTDSKAAAEKEGKKLAMPMKSYKTLPPADFAALTAYLVSLK